MLELDSKILCNICRSGVDGIAYKTFCKHFFCPGCAKSSFQGDCTCPVCKYSLKIGDVQEISIGIDTVDLLDTLYQVLFQNTNWESVIEQCNLVSHAAAEVTQFANYQLHQELIFSNKDKETLVIDIKDQISMNVEFFTITYY
jgi:hypothetical protein